MNSISLCNKSISLHLMPILCCCGKHQRLSGGNVEKQQLAASVLKAVGGADNLVKMSYCASRIRVIIRDTACFDRHALEALEAIKSVLEVDTAQHSTEYHLVVGPGNTRSLYEALSALTQQK